MAESDLHRDEMVRCIQTLRDAYAGRPDVYVSGNLLLYYEEGNPRASVAPDTMVVFGAPKLPLRRVYKLWEEGAAPSVVIEVTSPSTRREDQGKKRALYARLGVAEYFLYDPLAEYLAPALQGYRLERGDYRAMTPDEDGRLASDALDMWLTLVEGRLRFFDRRTGAMLLSPGERATAEAEARRAAERRIAELEALLARRPEPPL
jgi:Uma2 family endonuclease